VKQLLNTTDSGSGHAFGKATYLLMGRDNVVNQLLRNDGMVVNSFRMGTLTSPFGQDIRSLTKLFDVATWSFLIVSIFCLCLYFRIIFKFKAKSSSILETHVISILLEQSQQAVTRCSGFRLQTCFLLVS